MHLPEPILSKCIWCINAMWQWGLIAQIYQILSKVYLSECDGVNKVIRSRMNLSCERINYLPSLVSSISREAAKDFCTTQFFVFNITC